MGRHAARGRLFGTVVGGRDLQVDGSWVIGVFGDYDFGGIRGDVVVDASALNGLT